MGRAGGSAIDDDDVAALVLDELVTNAVLHAGTRIDVLVGLRGNMLRVAVADRSDGGIRRRSADDDEENGRGLALVEALTSAGGCSHAASAARSSGPCSRPRGCR